MANDMTVTKRRSEYGVAFDADINLTGSKYSNSSESRVRDKGMLNQALSRSFRNPTSLISVKLAICPHGIPYLPTFPGTIGLTGGHAPIRGFLDDFV